MQCMGQSLQNKLQDNAKSCDTYISKGEFEGGIVLLS